MKTLFMTIGLPASGKTTWAKEKMAEHPGSYKRVNKDDLRAMVDAGRWSQDAEKLILKLRDSMITMALSDGKHVIVDDTNLAPKHQVRLQQIARDNMAAFEVVDFTAVSVDECVARDQKRQNWVGEKVIRGMHSQFLATKPPVVERNPSLADCVIVDIDGTVALMNGRSPYDYSQVHTDLPHAPVISAVKAISEKYRVVFVSGRKHECRLATSYWLMEHVGMNAPLYMREDGDDRDDRIVKREIYENWVKPLHNVLFVLDDRDKVVRMWREIGLTCFQVAPGDF